MLQDFLASRPGLDSASAPALPASTRQASFQPLTVARMTELGAPAKAPVVEKPQLEEPQVEVIELEGKVRKIVVTCRCCEKIEIECEY